MKKQESILLIGSYGRGNIGDDVFLEAASSLFEGRTLYINSANDELLPNAIKGKVQTVQTGAASGIREKLRLFAKLTHIVYWGGDLWVELYGDRFPRQSLYKMVVLNFIARLFGKKIYYVGCGVGKLRGYSLFLARLSARLAKAIVVREERSAKLLALPHVQVLPDLAVNLPAFRTIALREKAAKKPLKIGVSLLYYVPNPEHNFAKVVHHIKTLLTSVHPNECEIILLPMLISEQTPKDDLWALSQLQRHLKGYNVSTCKARDINQYVEMLGELDVVIGTRLHANILATLAGIPCIGIAYRPKVLDFFKQHGLEEWCVEFDKLSELPTVWQQFITHQPEVKQAFRKARIHLLEHQKEYEAFVDAHF
ncbi:MAG TPA: polysaccharide pyruvyl transferase family protein [Candidatus Saccharimonadales bacterium]